MTALSVQQLDLPDCELRIRQVYYAWGRGNANDSAEPDWENASPQEQASIAQRGYLLYDGWPVQGDNEIGPTECYISTGINSRVVLNDVIRLIVRADETRKYLEAIPQDEQLEVATREQLDAAVQLVDYLCEAEYVSWGKVTKVLYKKRPAFIPILDTVVVDFLRKNFPHRPDQGIRGTLNLYREILLLRAVDLEAVQVNVANDGFYLSTSRILNLLIWDGWYSRAIPTPIRIIEVWGTLGLRDARQAAAAMWPYSPE